MLSLRRSIACPWMALWAVLLVPPFSSTLQGQDDDDDVTRRSLGALRVSDPESRRFRQDLRKAKEAMQQERYDDALSLLGAQLTGDPTANRTDAPVLQEDYFLPASGNAFTSIKSEALRLLDTIPAKALKRYELEHGAEAAALLKSAFQEGNAERLAEVYRRFFHTEAGYRAGLELGRLQLEQGRPQAAASYLHRLATTAAAQRVVEPEASVLLAAAQLHSGQPSAAKVTLLSLKQRLPNFSLRNAASPTFRDDDDALPWLEKIFGRAHEGENTLARQWTMFRGNAQRNAAAEFAEPTSTPRWDVPVANDPNDNTLIAEQVRAWRQQGLAPIPSIQPLALRGVVVFRGPEKLVAVNISSGKRIWIHPFGESSSKHQKEETANVTRGPVRPEQLKQRIWDDAPRGQLSSDGDVLYFVDGLGDVGPYANGPQMLPVRNNRFDRNPDMQQPHSTLRALSLKREGSEVWETQVKDKDDPLHGAFFLGAPLPVNGQLYVLAEIHGELALVALDAATGKLAWKQQIGHVENFPVMSDPLRRLAGASPSYADGIVVCPTSAGAVVAIDVATRRLLWGADYSRTSDVRTPRFDINFNSLRLAKYGDRWLDSSATIAEGRVILTPPDSPELHCFDLATGKVVWPPIRREDLLFVAGVHRGVIVIVGKSQVVGIQLTDGKRAWDLRIDTPTGRGIFDAQHYYQPTVSGKLLALDPVRGEVAHTYHTGKPLGNLTSYGDDIFSLSEECLAAYPRVDRLQARVEAALAKNPNDAWALARQGELLMHQEKWEEALAVLRRAAEQSPPDPATRGLLTDTMLALLEADYTRYESLAGELEKLVDDPLVKSRYFRTLGKGREKAGDRLGAFKAYMTVAANEGNEFFSTGDALMPLELEWQAKPERWLSARLAALYAEASEKERATMNERLEQALGSLPQRSPMALRAYVVRYGFHPIADESRLRLAQLLAEANNFLDAESVLRPVMDSSRRPLAGDSTALLAKILLQCGRPQEALVLYERLGKDFAEVTLGSGSTGRQVQQEAAKQFEYRKALAAAGKPFPRGKVVVEPDVRNTVRNVGDQRKSYPVALQQADTNGIPSPNLVLEPVQNALRIRAGDGRDLGLVSLSRNDNRRFYPNVGGLATARLSGHLLIVSTGYEVLGVNLLRQGRDPSEIIAWRHDLADVSDQGVFTMAQTRGLANPWAVPRFHAADSNNRPMGIIGPLTTSGLCFIKHKQLQCVDPLTGQAQWLRSDVEIGSDLFGDDEHLFVSRPNSEEAEVYRMADGASLGKRKVANFEHRWATCGARVLSWSQSGKGLSLQLDDAWTQQNIWTETAPSGSRAWLCAPDEVAILSIDGSLRIRSLRSDTTLLSAKLEREKELQQLVVLKSRDQYFVVVSLPVVNPLPNLNILAAPGGNHCPLVSGKVYAFNATTGKPSWSAPATVSQMGLPLDQPLDQPVLLFLRNVIPRSGPGAQKTFAHMLCLDKRTGAVAYSDQDIPSQLITYDLEADRETSSVRIAVQGKALRLRFTEDPAPPEPPMQNDQAFSGSRGVAEAIRRVFLPRDNSRPNNPPDEDPFN